MKKTFIVLQNSKGQTARVMPYAQEELELIFRHDLKRLEVVRDTNELTENEVSFESLSQITKASAVGHVLANGAWGQVKIVESVETPVVEANELKDEKQDFFFFLKWTAGLQIGALVLAMLIGWWIQHQKPEEAQIVKVFKREDLKMPTPVVEVSQKKIIQVSVNEVFRKKKSQVNKKVAVRTGKTQGSNMRSGNELSRMGALNAFGGMSQNSKGLGGLSNAPSKSAGYASDANRARGGSNKGLLGKGLLKAGIGSGETLQGYGGYGTNGRGQGQAGYGALHMAGRSDGYYLPMSEDATVEGGLDRDQIDAVIKRNSGQVRFCYESGLQSQPKLAGRVALKFVISPSGSVTLANVSHTSLDSTKVESCLVGKLRGWKFPKPRGNVAVKVSYPFMFKREGQG